MYVFSKMGVFEFIFAVIFTLARLISVIQLHSDRVNKNESSKFIEPIFISVVPLMFEKILKETLPYTCSNFSMSIISIRNT